MDELNCASMLRVKEEAVKQEQREFLFDPLAAAYYSKFADYDPATC